MGNDSLMCWILQAAVWFVRMTKLLLRSTNKITKLFSCNYNKITRYGLFSSTIKNTMSYLQIDLQKLTKEAKHQVDIYCFFFFFFLIRKWICISDHIQYFVLMLLPMEWKEELRKWKKRKRKGKQSSCLDHLGKEEKESSLFMQFDHKGLFFWDMLLLCHTGGAISLPIFSKETSLPSN